MALGFIYKDALYATPDKSLNRQVSPRVLTSSFGDGYEQRIAPGLNSIQETYTLQFKTRTKEFVDDVISFLDATKAVTKFNLKIPDTNTSGSEKTIKVVLTTYSVNYQYDNFYSLTVNVKRVYEA